MLDDMERFTTWANAGYMPNDNGTIMRLRGKGYISKLQMYQAYRDWLETGGKELDGSKKDVLDAIDQWINSNKPTGQQSGPKITVSEAVTQELKMAANKVFKINSTFNQVHYKNPDSKVWTNSSLDQVKDWLQMRWEDSPTLAPYKMGSIEAALKMIALGARNKAQNDVVENIKYDQSCEATRDQILHTVYDFLEVKQPYDQFEMVMCHWMWQIKRKISNQSVVWHIWPNLYGPTKIGKTWIVRHLCKPFEDFYLESTIGTLMEQTKEVMKFTENFVINFEELAMNADTKFIGGEGTMTADQMAVMKSMLTGDKMDTRIYGKQLQMKRDITFSCISTANYHLYDVFFDETSMRRYYEFECKRAVPGTQEERKVLNAMLAKATDMWRGIDETREKGYWDEFSKTGQAIDMEQRNYMPTRSTLLAWKSSCEFIPDESADNEATYTEYRDWCKAMGFRPRTLLNFNAEVAKRFPELMGNMGHPSFKAIPKNIKTSELDEG